MAEVTLRLDQIAALGRRPRGTAPVDTYRHIPGSVLRGALAASWIAQYGPPQQADPGARDHFLRLFEGPVRYGPLLDADSDVVPLSVLRCKYRPEKACEQFFHDQATDLEPLPRQPCCTTCGGRTQNGRGEVEFFGVDDHIVQETHVRLDEHERAEEGLLFTRRALKPRRAGIRRAFTGRIVAPPGEPVDPWLLQARPLRVGGRRSTAGGALYEAEDTPAPAPDPAFLVTKGRLVVRLVSPAFLVDAAGRPATRPDAGLLSELLGVKVTVDHAWIRRESTGGWNALTNLPKPAELAVSAGSAFRLGLGSTPTAQGLRRLLDHGLGLRRAEGFGWVALGPWHPPRAVGERQAQGGESLAVGLPRMLHQYLPEDCAWYLDKLHDVLMMRRRGQQPDLSFLRSKRAERLTQIREGRLARGLEALAEGDPGRLETAVLELRARVRKERSW
ncbi:type III-B CRISPR module-associated Cmr3 family protein [Streptomyces sp. NPDC012403]|uniref:type III-B CRISPR module-associated Cmr3 family protein n=1 Tax=Streptomyces sp. NPDC012403 TaxID=3364831 RepID=UPI0036E3F904